MVDVITADRVDLPIEAVRRYFRGAASVHTWFDHARDCYALRRDDDDRTAYVPVREVLTAMRPVMRFIVLCSRVLSVRVLPPPITVGNDEAYWLAIARAHLFRQHVRRLAELRRLM
jgi:hypothetical protein